MVKEGRSHERRMRTLAVSAIVAACSVFGVSALVFTDGGGSADGSPSPVSSSSNDVAATASASRCDRPYRSTSPWNRKIGGSPRIDARSAQRVAQIQGPLTSDPTQYTYPVYHVNRKTPRVRVTLSGVYSSVRSERSHQIAKAPTLRLPIPDNARPPAGSDAQIILVDRSTGDEWGVWQANRRGDSWEATNGYHYNTRWSGVPPLSDDGRSFVSRGAGVPYLTGLVRPCELERGRIDHALAFAFDSPGPRHIRPASKSDGDASGGPDAIPEGARLQLDPSITTAELTKLGCRGACRTIARALQRYGMYVIDVSGRSKVILEHVSTARWRGTISDKTVSPIPLSRFRLLDTGG